MYGPCVIRIAFCWEWGSANHYTCNRNGHLWLINGALTTHKAFKRNPAKKEPHWSSFMLSQAPILTSFRLWLRCSHATCSCKIDNAHRLWPLNFRTASGTGSAKAQPSPAQPSPAQPAQPSPAQPSPATPPHPTPPHPDYPEQKGPE